MPPKWKEYVEDDIVADFAPEYAITRAASLEALLAQLIREVREMKNEVKDLVAAAKRGQML